MKIHRYFFWIQDNFIEIYKEGKIERYDGEDRIYINNLEDFWKKWEKNSKIILSRDKVDFTFLIDERINRENLLKSIEKYTKDFSSEFSSEDLKKILDIKNIKKVIFNFNKEEVGNNINEDILKEILNQRVEEKEEEIEEGILDSYFKEIWKNKR